MLFFLEIPTFGEWIRSTEPILKFFLNSMINIAEMLIHNYFFLFFVGVILFYFVIDFVFYLISFTKFHILEYAESEFSKSEDERIQKEKEEDIELKKRKAFEGEVYSPFTVDFQKAIESRAFRYKINSEAFDLYNRRLEQVKAAEIDARTQGPPNEISPEEKAELDALIEDIIAEKY